MNGPVLLGALNVLRLEMNSSGNRHRDNGDKGICVYTKSTPHNAGGSTFHYCYANPLCMGYAFITAVLLVTAPKRSLWNALNREEGNPHGLSRLAMHLVRVLVQYNPSRQRSQQC